MRSDTALASQEKQAPRLLGLLVGGMTMAPLAVLVELQLVWSGALVLVGVVVTPLALFAL